MPNVGVLNVATPYSAGSAAWAAIERKTLAAPAASVQFASLAATWKIFRLVVVGTGAGATDLAITLNADAGAHYTWERLVCNAAAAPSAAKSINQANHIIGYGDTAAMSANAVIGSNGSVQGWGGTGTVIYYNSGYWQTPATITSIEVFLIGQNLATGTILVLEGVQG